MMSSSLSKELRAKHDVSVFACGIQEDGMQEGRQGQQWHGVRKTDDLEQNGR